MLPVASSYSQGYNLFAYCYNNPIVLADSNGNSPVAIAAALWGIAKTVVTAAACAVLAVAAGTAIGDTIKEAVESIERPAKYRDQSVYIMRDENSKKVMYVGRTNDPKRRQDEHSRDPRKEHLAKLEVVYTGLTKNEARVVEQALISAYTLPALDNARREIAPHNVLKFHSDVSQVISLWDGMIESELLCLMEG